MTEHEKRFLEKIGITPGPWYDNGREIFGANNTIICIPYNMKATDFICHVPELFLSLFKNHYYIGKWISAAQEDKTACEEFKNDVKMFFETGKDLESASGKTFEELLKLWEECK